MAKINHVGGGCGVGLELVGFSCVYNFKMNIISRNCTLYKLVIKHLISDQTALYSALIHYLLFMHDWRRNTAIGR